MCIRDRCNDALKLLNTVTSLIKSKNLFSPNEDLKEIKAEHLKYLAVPYYMGNLYGKSVIERKEKVLKANELYIEFLKLMQHYDYLSKTQIEDLKDVKTGVPSTNKLAPSDARDQLIKRNQTKKNLQQEMKLLKGYSDESKIREYYYKQLKFFSILAFEDINMNLKELESLLYLEKNPSPPPAVKEESKIPEKQPRKVSAGVTVPNDFVDKRLEFQKEVFGPGFPQPTITVEEWGDYEKKKMEENTKKFTEMNAREEAEKDADIDRDDISDKKTIKDREWDDWKDLHPKGSGNTKDKRI
eukprot:TRINITY_DN1370_c0_g1_i2.p1 TRINITY_DN1370_c0_g1~~TRINITY_DN1370_c0_g1_i2.p1  ORF type:complete len:299 (+),score=71.34 TRINITY_DN1370_c0_g1_i2:155-1051(+)